MAVDLRERGTVGCCYYVARDEKFYFMEDVKLGGVDVVDACTFCHIRIVLCPANHHTVRIFIEPTVILVSTKIDDAAIDRFDPEARSGASDNGHGKLESCDSFQI